MAPVEVDYVPRSIIAPVKNLKVVDKAFSLPLVSSAYTEVSRVTSPYVTSTMDKVSPMVETTWSKMTPVMESVKTQVEEKVTPLIPASVTETVQSGYNATVEQVSAAVEKVDNFACGGIDQLTEKVPQLKEATPQLMETTKSTLSSYLTSFTDYVTSFSISQVALKMVDAGLNMVDAGLKAIGSDAEGTVRVGVRKVHSTANTIRIEAVKKAGTERAKKIEEETIMGALLEVSGLQEMFGMLGFSTGTTNTTEGTEEETAAPVETTAPVETAAPVEIVAPVEIAKTSKAEEATKTATTEASPDVSPAKEATETVVTKTTNYTKEAPATVETSEEEEDSDSDADL